MKKPIVHNGTIYPDEICKPIELETAQGKQWLQANEMFLYIGNVERFSARKEKRRNTVYWYAYKRIEGILSKKYLGKSSELTIETLENAEDAFIMKTWEKRKKQEPVIEEDHVITYDLLSLSKKVKPPNLPTKLIKRNHLLARMQKPITLISAPAGFGKSTLLRMVYKANKKQIAWVSLDENDNSLFLFLRLLHASFQEIGIDITESDSLRLLKPEQIFDLLLERITDYTKKSGAETCLTLIFDNYHYIHNEQIHRGMRYLVKNLPSNVRIIIASQKKIPIYRNGIPIKDNLVEINEDDLRVSQDQALDFICSQIGREITPGLELETILELKGWVMGIVLIAATLKGGEKITRYSKISERKNFQQYLINNILTKYPKTTQKFLIQTSFLKELRGDLCEYVTGIANCEQIIQNLCAEDLILSKSDSKPEVYNFTEVFASVLNTQLLNNPTEEISELYNRAANWYLGQGDLSQAIPYFILSKSWDEVAEVMSLEDIASLQRYNEGSKILYWFSVLPIEVFAKNLEFLLISLFVVVLYGYRFEPADYEYHFRRIIQKHTLQPEVEHLIEAIIWALKNKQPIDEELLLKCKPFLKPSNFETLQYLISLYVLCTLTIGSSSVNYVEIESKLDKALERNFLFIYILGAFTYGSFLQQSGYLHHAEEFIEKALHNINKKLGRYSTTTIFLLAIKALIHIERNQSEEALQIIEMIPFYSRKRLPILDSPTYLYYLLSIKFDLYSHNSTAAQKNLDFITQFYKQFPSKLYQVDLMQSLHAEIYIQKKNFRIAEDLLNSGVDLLKIQEAAIAWCHCLIHRKRYSDLEDFTINAIQNNYFSLRYSSGSSLAIFNIVALLGRGKIFKARDDLIKILPSFCENNALHPFMEVGNTILLILKILSYSGRLDSEQTQFIEKVFKALGKERELRKIDDDFLKILPVFSLSQRENEILNLILEGKTNLEMANTLYLSNHTIKTHIHNIYSKLAINSRFELIKLINLTKEIMISSLNNVSSS